MDRIKDIQAAIDVLIGLMEDSDVADADEVLLDEVTEDLELLGNLLEKFADADEKQVRKLSKNIKTTFNMLDDSLRDLVVDFDSGVKEMVKDELETVRRGLKALSIK